MEVNIVCAFLGNFNADLLKFEKHQPTNDFLYTMRSCCFQRQFSQLTRITHHLATL